MTATHLSKEESAAALFKLEAEARKAEQEMRHVATVLFLVHEEKELSAEMAAAVEAMKVARMKLLKLAATEKGLMPKSPMVVIP